MTESLRTNRLESHELYTSKDFTQAETEARNSLYVNVVEGGLGVCKKCGRAEVELEENYCDSKQVPAFPRATFTPALPEPEKVQTPLGLGIKTRKQARIIPPPKGWEESTWYIVDVAYSVSNVIHRALFYTGFLSEEKPSGYNMLVSPGYEDPCRYSDAIYLKAVGRLFSEDEMGDE